MNKYLQSELVRSISAEWCAVQSCSLQRQLDPAFPVMMWCVT